MQDKLILDPSAAENAPLPEWANRSIAVFHAKIDRKDVLWYCELRGPDLVGAPQLGDTFVYQHRCYTVANRYFSLGARDIDGSVRDGDSKLLEILDTVYGSDRAFLLYAGLRNIGTGKTPASSGILVEKKLIGEFGDLVYVVLKEAGGQGSARTFDKVRTAISALTDRKISTGFVGGESSAVLTPIKVQSEGDS